MKNSKLLLFISFLSFIIFNSFYAQNINIPDHKFKQALLNYSPTIDTNNDNSNRLRISSFLVESTKGSHSKIVVSSNLRLFSEIDSIRKVINY